MKGFEIERKFLLNSTNDTILSLPSDSVEISSGHSDQNYISIYPEIRIREYVIIAHKILGAQPICNGNKDIFVNTVQLLKEKTRHELTFKSDGTLTRRETNIIISDKKYNELLKFANGSSVRKYYNIFSIPTNMDTRINIIISDVDPDSENTFAYAEIEFNTELEASAFIPNFEYIKDVTNDAEYKMKYYWLKHHANIEK